MNRRLLIEGNVTLLPNKSQEFMAKSNEMFFAVTLIAFYDSKYYGNRVFIELNSADKNSKVIKLDLIDKTGVSNRTTSFESIFKEGIEGDFKLILFSETELEIKFKLYLYID